MSGSVMRAITVFGLAVVVGLGTWAASGPGLLPAGLAGPMSQVMASGQVPVVPGQYIVVLRPGADAAAVANDHGAAVIHRYSTVFNGFAARVPDARLARLQADPRVLRVEPDEVHQIADFATGIDRIEVDQLPALGPSSTPLPNLHVAVIDTGIASHAALTIAGGRNFAGGNQDAWGDGNGHGTHVAGTIGGTGGIGVAPGVNLWAVKVCSNGGTCLNSNQVAGIDWVAQQKSNGTTNFAAANFSISSSDSDKPCTSPANAVHRAICGLVGTGVVFVMAAGNENRAKVPYSIAFSVSAVADFDGKAGGAGAPTCRSDEDDTLANFSNYSKPDSSSKVKIAAPGVCIYSTWLNGGYNTISGTSMAAPHVTGAVALYLHRNGQAPATDAAGVGTIENAIIGSALAIDDPCGYRDTKDGGPMLFVNSAAFGGNGSCDSASGNGGGGNGGGDGNGGGSGGDMTVESITYNTTGNGKHLQVTVKVVDANSGLAVSGATVSITLTKTSPNPPQSWNGSGTTGSAGTVTFTLNNAPNGCYTTTVNDVTHASLTWDGASPANSFGKGTSCP